MRACAGLGVGLGTVLAIWVDCIVWNFRVWGCRVWNGLLVLGLLLYFGTWWFGALVVCCVLLVCFLGVFGVFDGGLRLVTFFGLFSLVCGFWVICWFWLFCAQAFALRVVRLC